MGDSGEAKMDRTVNNEESSEGKKSPLSVENGPAQVSSSRRTGGWRTAPYIFGTGAIDFLASIGIMVNMLKFLKDRLGLTTADAANTVTNFLGMCSYTPLLGAFIADAYLGRYRTILFASMIYVLGLVALVINAALPTTRSPKCSKSECLGYLYSAFILIAVAAGGIRPNAPSFGADQFDQKDPAERQQLYGYFNWYYFFIVVAIITSSTLLVYVQNTYSWVWGFSIPAVAMAIAVTVFWAGSPLYRRMVPTGSPFTRLAQVAVAAFRKRSRSLPDDPSSLFQEEQGDKLQLCHTMQFRYLDKAAIVIPGDFPVDSTKPNPWRLCGVNQVEELKSLMRMAPVWATGIPIFIIWSQQTTFWLAEGFLTDLRLGPGKFQIPGGSLPVFSALTMLVFLPVYDRLLVPLAKRITGNPRGITFLQRIGIGIIFAGLSMVAAGVVAGKRKEHSMRPALSCFWLAPQFCLLGLSEAFVTIGYLEFFYDQSPPSMRSMAAGVVWAIIGTGSYLSSLVVFLIKRWTSRPHGARDGWLATNPNDGHYEYFYWLLAALMGVDLILHLFVSATYKYSKPNYADGDNDDKLPVMF